MRLDDFISFKQALITCFGGIFIFLFGAWDIMFQVLVVFVVLDYITGVMKGYVTGELSSKTGFKGIIKKMATIATVIVAVLIDRIMNVNCLRTATIFCLIGNEGISLLENFSSLGVPIPIKLMEALKQLRNKGDINSDEK